MIRRLVAIAVLGGVLASAVYVFRFGWPEPLRPIVERLSLTTAQKKAAPTQPPPMIPEVEVITVEPKKEVPFPIVYAGRIASFARWRSAPRLAAFCSSGNSTRGRV